MIDNKIFEITDEIVMVPIDANLFMLELWEILLIAGVMFILGAMLGMYIVTQIEHSINKRIKYGKNEKHLHNDEK